MRIYQGCLDPTLGELWEVDSFIPTNLAGCQFWYDGTMPNPVHATGGNADAFYDLSGNGRNALQATPSKQPLIVSSGSGIVLRGDGISTTMTALFARNQPTYLAVLTKWTAAANKRLIDGGSINGNQFIAADSTHYYIYSGSYGVYVPMAAATWQVLEGFSNGASSWGAVNGGVKATGAGGALNCGGVTLFSRFQLDSYAVADIGAVVCYDSDPTDFYRQRIVNYLRRAALKLGQFIML